MPNEKSHTQIRLDKYQDAAKIKAENSAIREVPVDIPSDVDEDRLREVAADISTDTPHFDESSDNDPQEKPIPDGTTVLVLSVTTMPSIPAKRSSDDIPPEMEQKFNILVECSRPLQLGQTYKLKSQ